MTIKNLPQPTHPLVLLLGAGASKGGVEGNTPSPPVDADFFDVARSLTGHGTQALAKRVLRSVWELYQKTNDVGLEEYYRDVETRAAISVFAKSANRPKNWEKRKDDLEELIRRVYIQTTADLSTRPPEPKKSMAHQAIMKYLKPGSTIITFNYDLVIEESFENAELWNPKDGYGTRVHRTTSGWCQKWLEKQGYKAGAKSKVLLLKLHGSLGWTQYKQNQKIRLKARPYTVRKNKSEEVSVVPPGWNKKVGINPYKKFWYEARLALESCKSLIVVGYSLPETDLLARALFAEAVRLRASRENYLDHLILADPSPAVHEKLVKIFSPALGPLGKVIRLDNISNFLPDGAPKPIAQPSA